MRAIVIEQAGTAQDLKMTDLPKPSVGQNDVLIEVHYTALNPIDSAFRSGMMPMANGFPAVLGIDFAGVVVETGIHVADFAVGDEVFTHNDMNMGGGLAEYAAVNEKNITRQSPTAPLRSVATLGIAPLTAYQMVHELADVQPGEKVLVYGGSGGVGTFAVQFAKLAGAEVYATTSSSEELLRSLGVDHVLNYKEENVAEVLKDSMDVLIDAAGKGDDVLAAVKEGGRAATTGDLDAAAAAERHIVAQGFVHRIDTEQMEEFARMVGEGTLQVVIDSEFPFTEEGVREAYAKLDEGHTSGKILVKVR